MATPEYLQAALSRLKGMLPPSLWAQVHAAARATAGGLRSSPKAWAPDLLERAAVLGLGAKVLAEAKAEDLEGLHDRLHDLSRSAAPDLTQPLAFLHAKVAAEMVRRGRGHVPRRGLDFAAATPWALEDLASEDTLASLSQGELRAALQALRLQTVAMKASDLPQVGPGIFLSFPHAPWLAGGFKTALVTTERFKGQGWHIVLGPTADRTKARVWGWAKLRGGGEGRALALPELREHYTKHRTSDGELARLYPGKARLWLNEVEAAVPIAGEMFASARRDRLQVPSVRLDKARPALPWPNASAAAASRALEAVQEEMRRRRMTPEGAPVEKAAGATVRAVLISRIHRAFTSAADDLFGLGFFGQEERIGLSSAIGDALGKFNALLDASPPLAQAGDTAVSQAAAIELLKKADADRKEEAALDLIEKPGLEDREGWAEMRYRVRDPRDFQPGAFVRAPLKKTPPLIDGVFGRLRGERTTTLQALRFPKDEWTREAAQAWIRDHPDLGKAEDLEKARRPFAVYGSLERQHEDLLKMVPPHERYVEVFAGAGELIWNKARSKEEILNDLDPNMTFRFNFLREMTPQQLAALKARSWLFSWDKTKQFLDEKQNGGLPKDPVERFYRLCYAYRFARPNPRGGGPVSIYRWQARHGQTPEADVPARLPAGKERLQGVKVRQEDYRKILKGLDGAETFFFADPPYPGTFDYYNKLPEFDWTEAARLTKAVKGKAMWIIGGLTSQSLKDGDPLGEFRRLFTETRLRRDHPFSRMGGSNRRTVRGYTHLSVFTNYNPKAVKGWPELGEEEGQEKAAGAFLVPILKVDTDRRLAYGVVLEPGVEDTQGDVPTAEAVEGTCHNFLARYRIIGEQHQKVARPTEIVECYIAPQALRLGEQEIGKGAWIMAVRVLSDSLWQDVKAGKYTGFSIGGYGETRPVSRAESPVSFVPA